MKRHQHFWKPKDGKLVCETPGCKRKTKDMPKRISRRSKIKKRKAPKKVKTGTLKHKLDATFQAMIRERDWTLMCISCLIRQVSQAGHFMRRELMATRWHPWNVNGQCAHCNCWQHGNLLEYQDNLDKKFGDGTAQYLRQLARTSWKPSREALEKLLEAAKLGPEAYSEIWEFYGAKL